MFSKRDMGDTENIMEDQIEGSEDNEPGNQRATKSNPVPSRKVSKKPTTPFAISKSGGKAAPKARFVNRHPSSKAVRSGTKNRSGKKFKRGVKHPPTVSQKMKSFGGMY